MPSQALTEYEERLQEINQLLDAHNALTRWRRAESQLQVGGQFLQNISTVINHLVNDPGVGRPKEVHALNSAAIALLSGHLQGYIVDLFKESANSLLNGKVADVATLTNAAYTRGNPNEQNISAMFAALGFPNIMDGITWQHMTNRQLKIRLREFNELRNRIVHGSPERVRKTTVQNYFKAFQKFAKKLDAKVAREIRQVVGNAPW